MPGWLLGLAAAFLFLGAVVLAFVAGVGTVGVSIGRSLLTALIVALIAWLWFGFYTGEGSTRDLRRRAKTGPELLFDTPPDVGAAQNVIGRDGVVRDLMSQLRPDAHAGPQVVVGDTGAGKTSLLLRLAATIAEDRDAVPIVLSLRNVTAEALNFHALARARFEDYIDPHIRAENDVDRLWRWLFKRGKIFVLADDLDRARLPNKDEDPYGTVARAALEAARRRQLPLVVTSRPFGVPRNLAEPPIALEALELSPERAAEELSMRAGRKGDDRAIEVAREAIERGRLLDNPFYLGLVRDLLAVRKLEPVPAGDPYAVRVALLGQFYDSMIGEHLAPHERDRRVGLLDELSVFAAATLAPDQPGRQFARASRKAAPALSALERSGVVYLDDDGHYRFGHEVLHAYFAARALALGDASLQCVEQAPDAPRVQLALILAAAMGHAQRFCAETCKLLLADATRYEDERRLLRAAAAAEIAVAGRYTGLDRSIADECAEARPDASPIARRAALDSLAELGGARAVEVIWEYAGDPDYGVRWAATQALVRRCSSAHDSTRPELILDAAALDVISKPMQLALEHATRSCQARAQPDDWEPVIAPLKQMAWMLPALETAIAESGAPRSTRLVRTLLGQLLNLVERNVTPQRGLDASVAQGFKVDARLHRRSAIDPRVIERLNSENPFWYSQVNLLQAVTLRAADGTVGQGRSILSRFASDGEAHPFVRATATLCERALVEAADADASRSRDARIDRSVWEDESVLVARTPREMVDEAIQLVGEMTVLLDMNEGRTPEERIAFGEAQKLPYCIERSRDRAEFFSSCPDACGLGYCPLRPPVDRLSAHREISRAFCHHQRLHASAKTAKRLWGSAVDRDSLHEFWRKLESRATF